MRPSRGTKIRKETILYAEPDKNAPPRWLKIRETADKLNVSETTVRRLLASGDLEGAKVRGAVRVDGFDVDRYLKKRRYTDLRKLTAVARVRKRLLARQAARARQR